MVVVSKLLATIFALTSARLDAQIYLDVVSSSEINPAIYLGSENARETIEFIWKNFVVFYQLQTSPSFMIRLLFWNRNLSEL